MRALTLHQPWAQLMVWGLKNIATRSWPAPQGLIGQRIAIPRESVNPGPLSGISRCSASSPARRQLSLNADGRGCGDQQADRVYSGYWRTGRQWLGQLPRLRGTQRPARVRCNNYGGPLRRLLGGKVAVGIPGPASGGAGSGDRTAGCMDVAGYSRVRVSVRIDWFVL